MRQAISGDAWQDTLLDLVHWRKCDVFPNALPPIIVVLTMGMGSIVGAEVILSWLGIGIQPPTPSLGNMIREAQNISVLQNYPHMLIPPVLVVALLIFAWNLLGDAINDFFNPRSR